MAVIEIVGGVILLVVSVVIFALTLMQHTHGQGWCHQRQRLRRKQRPSDPCGPDAGKGDPHRRYHLLCGGHPGLRVRKPSGLSMRPQPRDESGAVFVSICCYKRDKREEAAPRWRAGYGS